MTATTAHAPTPTTAPAVDPDRLARAVHLDAVALPGGSWKVGEWTVDRRGGCDCPDALYRPATPCKHVLTIRLACLDAAILDGLRALLRTLER